MEIKIINGTKEGYTPTKGEMDSIAGHSAGVCYLADTMETLLGESKEKTERRTMLIKGSGHHSPFDHSYITLQIKDVPKIVAMVLNNEAMYTTSEKSARYTKMVLTEKEQALYDKWCKVFENEMKERLKQTSPNWFTDKKILKLAQENARYLTSVFTPTTMVYTISYRQFNVLYSLISKEIPYLRGSVDKFSDRLADELDKFAQTMKEIKDANGRSLLDEALLKNPKGRKLSLFKDRPVEKVFGDVYSTAYKGSFAQYAQEQRHRTLTHNITMLEKPEFYVPPILKAKPELVNEWIKDCFALADNFPQAMLVMISERGTFENFIQKVNERSCAQAQLEINQQTTATTNEMYNALKGKDAEKEEILEKYLNGSRCTAGYKCSNPCGFKDGITGERIV